jgi:hypothetical protein
VGVGGGQSVGTRLELRPHPILPTASKASSDAGKRGHNYPRRSPGYYGPATCSFAGSSVDAMRF